MQPNRRLSDILPLRFRSGEQVRQFSKPCIRCGNMLNAQHMVGVAQLIDDQIAIAAKAQCPVCGERFSVTCLIDGHKHVRRVVLPYWIFNPYLRTMSPAESQGVVREESPSDELPMTPTLSTEIPAPEPRRAPMPQVDVERSDESVGRYQGKPIPAWVRVNGKVFNFERIAADARTREGEFLLDGCLVYRGQ